MMGLRLILGSASPRRAELLGQLGIAADAITPADIDETPAKLEMPRDYVARMSREKLAALPARDDAVTLCADTTVTMGRRIMGKPENAAEAASFLYAMSGRRHRVITAISVGRGADSWHRVVESVVKFKVLSDAEVNAYIASGEWAGKAGGYAIQGRAAAFIPWISGSFSAIVGLPLSETAALLHTAGYRAADTIIANGE
ncbi:Maf family protein [Ketogulonicigenium vulgare]|nr:nucleoside triphosphate pyrophosphatase [Ketogulonicigenium vulgare]ADO43152.1 putative Maf-like protein [Ketogulonicigenium vulgare Y25]ALJ81584.1 septum formation protein Maf [Ketogulonicigenium vulgare]ANW34265.1 septum formation protein Maf [Ketogulonicigenium vulgare]AOZ55189.1 Maf-like protein [Ketogulonicigenium vulgare]